MMCAGGLLANGGRRPGGRGSESQTISPACALSYSVARLFVNSLRGMMRRGKKWKIIDSNSWKSTFKSTVF